MRSLIIRNVPEATVVALENLAQSRKRSLEAELLQVIGKAALLAPDEETTEEFALHTVTSGQILPFRRIDYYNTDER